MYNHTNNGHAVLANPITESSTTFILSGTYNTLPTSNFIMKVSKYTDNVLVWRENVYVATRSGTTCTGIIRQFEEVPLDDATNALVQQALPFPSWSICECVVSSAFVSEILKSYRNSLAIKGVLVTDATGQETYVTWTSGQVVWFWGGGVPTAFSPTVNIDWLTAETVLDTTDTFVFYDASALVNKKITVQNLENSILSDFQSGSSSSESTSWSSGWTSKTVVIPNGWLATWQIYWIYNSGSAHPNPTIQWSANGTTGWTTIVTLVPWNTGAVVGSAMLKSWYTRYVSWSNGYNAGHSFTVQIF